MIQTASDANRIDKFYQDYLEENFSDDPSFQLQKKQVKEISKEIIDPFIEKKCVEKFLLTSCKCGRNCQLQFSAEELITARFEFYSLSSENKNSYILGQLRLLSKHSKFADSARIKTLRKRQKFEYKMGAYNQKHAFG